MSEWCEDEDRLDPTNAAGQWRQPTCCRASGGRWWERLWSDVLALGDRYRLRPGNGWWEQPIVVEALAALAAWVERYDTGESDDPPRKLGLLYDVERVRELIGGGEPFYPDRDRGAFVRFLIDAGCQPPPSMGGEATFPPDRRR